MGLEEGGSICQQAVHILNIQGRKKENTEGRIKKTNKQKCLNSEDQLKIGRMW